MSTKKKVLILCAHRRGRSPSQRYRFEQYLDLLEQHGFEFTLSPLLNERNDRVFYSPRNFAAKAFILAKSIFIRMKDWRRFDDFDIIFVQRETLFIGSAFFEKRAAASKARLIFDFDDSIWLKDTSPENKKWEFVKRPEKFYEAVRKADFVVAGNDYLAAEAQRYNPNTRVIPTTVNTDVHFPLPELRGKHRLVIGWSGSISTLKHFKVVVPVLKRLAEEFPSLQIKLLADREYSEAGLSIISEIWSAERENEVLNSFDIGIMPLPDDEWTKGKCGLKALSYMACGVPVVASPVGVNTTIIKTYVNGVLATTEEEWLLTLRELITYADKRKRLGDSGRHTVEQKYSVKANFPLYLRLFTESSTG